MKGEVKVLMFYYIQGFIYDLPEDIIEWIETSVSGKLFDFRGNNNRVFLDESSE